MLKLFLRLGLSAIPLSVYQRLYPRDVIGLCYHIVSDEAPAHVAHVCPFKTSAQFEADLRYLADNYEVISYEQWVERRAASGEQRVTNGTSRSSFHPSSLALRPSSSRPSVLLTFDDGFRECYTVVRPLLQEYGFPAIFFVTTDFIDNQSLFYRNKVSLCIEKVKTLCEAELHAIVDTLGVSFSPDACRRSAVAENLKPETCRLTPETCHLRPRVETWLHSLTHRDRNVLDRLCDVLAVDIARFLRDQRPYLTTDQIETLQADGHTIGAHGRSHVRLSELESDADVESEIVESCRIVSDLTGSQQVPFAFPFADRGVTAEQISGIRRHNPHIGFFFNSRGLLPLEDLVVHRISSDEPDNRRRNASNLPALIHDSYERHLRRHVVEPLKKKRAARIEKPATSI